MKKVIILVCGFAFILAGCGTVAGAGKDIERGGRAIERAANNASK